MEETERELTGQSRDESRTTEDCRTDTVRRFLSFDSPTKSDYSKQLSIRTHETKEDAVSLNNLWSTNTFKTSYEELKVGF